ncbi:long-chain fatty acid transport protein [Pseudomonas sp. ok272]|uniref:OmpP1/FadL family transporter n=1 Tax=unclassified Pseudomonas TaxID=196821 RepID=UPI0008C01D21|nr:MULTISPECIES: OmpP1/FadL family transporter [unclassified Pseudomonas]SEN38711.1 long-chain fatty acid transport protein [Pseudomonas sp. ok272]SFN22819.1 long-chain fatty acid transport protein [Pseudomonas sp. ok602]
MLMKSSMLGLVVLCCQQASAGGLTLYEYSTDNVGLANAGVAARAQGPSTIAANPAGLSYLDGTQITAGAQLLYGDLGFSRDDQTNVSGGNGGNALVTSPSASFFVSHRLDDNWSIGFGTYGDFGLAADFGDSWSGRYVTQKESLVALSLVPSVAYRFNDQWSVGLGIKAMYGMLKTQAAIDRSPLGLTDRSDGQLKYSDNTWGYGANLGVIYSPQPSTRIGLAYTSEVKFDFKDHLTVYGQGPALRRLDGLDTQLTMHVPQTVTLSLYQELDQRWALLATANWQDWSRFGDVTIDVDTSAVGARATTINADYKDTYQLAFGTQYNVTPQLLWNAGIAYDTSAVSDSNRTVTVPMGDSWRLATGATYALDKDTEVNVSWVMAWLGNMPVDQSKTLSGDRISGEFTNAWLQAVTGNMTWRF